MGPRSAMLLLPASLLALVAQTAASGPSVTAIKKLSPDSNEKLFPEHLAFAPQLQFEQNAEDTSAFPDYHNELPNSNVTARLYHPAFARHYDESEDSVLRRAAEALALLQKRSSCPAGMTSCTDTGSPAKCCQKGTYCNNVQDKSVGGVACCPNGSTCGGGVGNCPADAVSCPAALGGGCCIAGYICKGIGCVPSPTVAPNTVTKTTVQSSTKQPSPETVTKTQTTVVGGSPSTVIVTMIVTKTSAKPTTKTTTDIVTAKGSGTRSATGAPPWRPISSSTMTTAAPDTSSDSTNTKTSSDSDGTSDSGSSQDGCPTGFYGCMATHGGGCCRTDRNCHTFSCPAPSSTTIVSDGATIVVAATNAPEASPTATCAGGWFMCGDKAGPVAGCCPSGYSCGTASCFTVEASQTGSVQKERPEDSMAGAKLRAQRLVWGGLVGACFLALVV